MSRQQVSEKKKSVVVFKLSAGSRGALVKILYTCAHKNEPVVMSAHTQSGVVNWNFSVLEKKVQIKKCTSCKKEHELTDVTNAAILDVIYDAQGRNMSYVCHHAIRTITRGILGDGDIKTGNLFTCSECDDIFYVGKVARAKIVVPKPI